VIAGFGLSRELLRIAPFSLLARFEGDKVAYVQFLEDSYGTAGSFKTGGITRFHSDPSGKK